MSLDLRGRKRSGAAVECRIYAEKPDEDFLPAVGRLLAFTVPDEDGLRVDSGVVEGSEVSVYYDPMLAKVITHGRDRSAATRKMIRALKGLVICGVETNREFLIRVLEHPAYQAGDLTTHFVEAHRAALFEAPSATSRHAAARAVVLAEHQMRRQHSQHLPEIQSGFRNNAYCHQTRELEHGEARIVVRYRSLSKAKFEVIVGDGPAEEVCLVSWTAPSLVVKDSQGVRRTFQVFVDGQDAYVHSDGVQTHFKRVPRFPNLELELPEGGCVAPMPGKVVQLLISEGHQVAAGQVLLVLEAMKMEQKVRAKDAGIIRALHVRQGDQVEAGQVLAVVSKSPD